MMYQQPEPALLPGMNTNPQVGQELREAVARVLGCDPKELRPR